MKITQVITDPSLRIDLENDIKGTRDVIFLWEEGLYQYPIYSDIVRINEGVNFFSSINKPISFFDGGIIFKVIDLQTHEVLFSHSIKNLSFLNGKRILYVAQNNHTGYGYAARNCIHQLLESGYQIQWASDLFGEDQNRYTSTNKYEQRVLSCRNNHIEYDSVILHYVPFGYENLLNKITTYGKTIYASTVWETTKLPSSWSESINKYTHGVIVPSIFNRQVLKDSNINVPVHLWRYDTFPIENHTITYDIVSQMSIYEDGRFKQDSNKITRTIKNNTVYYNISQYSARKNVDQTLFTFCSKFTSNDNVCFLLKIFFRTFDVNEQEILKYKIKSVLSYFDNPPKIIVCLTDLNSDQIDELHKLGDVYFTLNRGEGFGLCSYTAKKFGNRVICGGFGSEVEFLDGNDTIIPYRLVTPTGMIGFHNWYDSNDQLWASFNNDDVVSKLRFYPKREA